MKISYKSPSYLVRNPHSYCFRLIVPKDLQSTMGKKELRYSLKTGYLDIAKQRARLLAGQVRLIFRLLRRGNTILNKLSDEQIQALVHQHIKQSIESWDRNFYEIPDDDVPGNHPFEMIDHFETMREDLVAHLHRGDFRMLEKPIAVLLEKNGITDLDKSSLEYRKLCAEIHKAEIQLMPLQKKHMLCDFSYKRELPRVFPDTFPHIKDSMPTEDEQTSEVLQKVVDAFWKENSPNWKPRTVTEFRTFHNHLLDFLGHDRMIHSVDYQTGRDYKDLLSNTKTKRGKQMSSARIDMYIGYAAQVLNWAIRQNFTKINPFAGLRYGKKKQKRADKQRDAFTTDDLNKIFVDSSYFGQDKWAKCKHPHFFWIPLLELYTGARLEEIAQLYTDDIKLIEGTYSLDFKEDRPDKSIKTGEQRIIPLHDFLVQDLNFIGYIQSLPKDSRVFPELKRVNHRYSHGFSMWFSGFVKRCGVTDNKTFHSFRHLVTSLLLEKDVAEYRIAQFVGHVTESQTTGRYGKRFKPKMLKEKVVDKLDFGIDLSHLKQSHHVDS